MTKTNSQPPQLPFFYLKSYDCRMGCSIVAAYGLTERNPKTWVLRESQTQSSGVCWVTLLWLQYLCGWDVLIIVLVVYCLYYRYCLCYWMLNVEWVWNTVLLGSRLWGTLPPVKHTGPCVGGYDVGAVAFHWSLTPFPYRRAFLYILMCEFRENWDILALWTCQWLLQPGRPPDGLKE